MTLADEVVRRMNALTLNPSNPWQAVDDAVRLTLDVVIEAGVPLDELGEGKRMEEFGTTFSCDCGNNHVHPVDPTASLGEDEVCDDCGSHLADRTLFGIVTDTPAEKESDALACVDCGEMKVVEGACLNCGSSDQSEPFRAGWDESDENTDATPQAAEKESADE